MKKYFIIMALVLLSGCSTHLSDLSVMSNKNIEANSFNMDTAQQVKNVVGRDTTWVILYFPIGRPQLKEALNDALKKADGDIMIDISMYHKAWWFLIGQQTLELQGTVLKSRGAK